MKLSVDKKRLWQSLETIVGERSPFGGQQHLAAVERLVAEECSSCGLDVEDDWFSYGEIKYRNILGRRIGKRRAPLIILGAHIDSVTHTPGADDNASGVAVMLEAARLLGHVETQSEILFCAFNLEELNMIGSTAFAHKLKAAGTQVAAMISLEMVGYTDTRPGSQQLPAGLARFYPDRGDFIGIVGNWKSNRLLRRFSAAMREVSNLKVETLSVPGNGMLIPAVRLSDHAPFWDLGYPALMVTDTSFYRNPHYHGSTDSIDTLDLEFMAKVCEGVVNALIALDRMPANK